MNQKNKNLKVEKYMSLYMSLGACFGLSLSLIIGNIFYTGNFNIGLCFGPIIGMCVGMLVGQAKDKRLSENIMTIIKIETAEDESDALIYVNDENKNEKQYIVSKKEIKGEKMVEGDIVTENIDGSLISLEAK